VGLVEVVDVEDDAPLRRGEGAEVHQVRVAAGLHADAGAGRARQVGRHDRRRAAVEGEGRGQHAAVADRHQVLDAALAAAHQQFDRVGTILGRAEAGMALARAADAQRAARLDAFGARAQVGRLVQVGGIHHFALQPLLLQGRLGSRRGLGCGTSCACLGRHA